LAALECMFANFLGDGAQQEDVVIVVGGLVDFQLQVVAGRAVGVDDVGGFPGFVLEGDRNASFVKNGGADGILGDDDIPGIVGVAVVPFHENVSVFGNCRQRDGGVDIILAAARHDAHFGGVHANGNGVLVFLAAQKQHDDGYDCRHQKKVVFHVG